MVVGATDDVVAGLANTPLVAVKEPKADDDVVGLVARLPPPKVSAGAGAEVVVAVTAPVEVLAARPANIPPPNADGAAAVRKFIFQF